jgi:hypothetical protein
MFFFLFMEYSMSFSWVVQNRVALLEFWRKGFQI